MSENQNIKALKYPIGKYETPQVITGHQVDEWVKEIASFPDTLTKAVEGLSHEMLAWRYRPSGWMIKQVVHHCADSHMNAFMRFKLTLTESQPAIRPYYEDAWAKQMDSLLDDISPSLMILVGLHQRWASMLQELNQEDLSRIFHHPEHGRSFRLDETIGNYAWHCRHHLAHIKQAKEAAGKYNEG